MKNKTIGIIAATTAVAVAAGTVGWQVADNKVQIVTEDSRATVHTFGDTVADAVAKQKLTIGEHDMVVPSMNSPIADNTVIDVAYGRPLTLILDGKTTTIWTTATTVDSALQQLGMTEAGTRLSLSRATPLGREGLELTVTTPKSVTVEQYGHPPITIETTAGTVGDLLTERRVALGKGDSVAPAKSQPLVEGLKVVISESRAKTRTTTEPIPHKTVTVETDILPKGQRKVEIEGKDGETSKTWQVTVVNGKESSKKLLTSVVTKEAVTERVLVGTGTQSTATPEASAEPTSKGEPTRSEPTRGESRSTDSPQPRRDDSGSGDLNLARADMWDRIAMCESSGNWSINTGNGYYGGLQFDKQTWLSAGGGKYAPTANLATRAEQITIANKVYAQRGLQPWGCAHAA